MMLSLCDWCSKPLLVLATASSMASGGVDAPPEMPILFAPLSSRGLIWRALSMKWVFGCARFDISYSLRVLELLLPPMMNKMSTRAATSEVDFCRVWVEWQIVL